MSILLDENGIEINTSGELRVICIQPNIWYVIGHEANIPVKNEKAAYALIELFERHKSRKENDC